MSDRTYTLGQKVRFTHVMGRDWEDGRGFWESREMSQPDEGIVMGKRTLSNGELETITETDGVWGYKVATHTEYRPTEHLPAYLIAFDLRRKPVLVSPEHMEVIV